MFYVSTTPLAFEQLATDFEGELYFDTTTSHQAIRKLYSTDGSVYQEMPLAVALPRSSKDIQQLIAFATRHQLTLIPRAAGTSLVGQVVGNGIVVDLGRHMNCIVATEREQGQGDMADMASCPYCCPHAGTFALPPPDTAGPGLVHPDMLLPPLFYLAPRPLFAWAASHPRAPPLAA